MDPSEDLLANAGGNHLSYIPSLEQNGYRTRNRTATAVHNVGPEVRSDAPLLRVKKASRVAQILTDSISKAAVLDGIGSTKNSFPSNCEQYTLPEKEQIIKDIILSTPSLTSKRAKKFKPDEIKEATNAFSPQSSYPVNHISGSNISTESLTEHELLYKGANNASPILLRSSSNSPAVSHLSKPAKTESILGSDSSDYLLRCQIADSAKSPPDRKKRTSKMGIKSKMEGLNNVTDSPKAFESLDGCREKVSNTQTPHALGKSSELQSGQTSVHAPRCVLIQPAQVPSEAQLEKLLAMNSERHDLQCPPRWLEGDLLWAKVSGHPFWPCMVSRCPFSKMYTRIKGDARIVRSYHVQFFGNEVERGWIAERSLIIFEGRLKFLEMSPSDSPRSMIGKGNPFKVNITRRHAWNIAVEEAEGAATLSKEERNVQYTFDYIFMNDIKKEQQTSKLLDSSQVQVNDTTAYKPKTDAARKRSRSETNNISPAANSNNKRRRLAFDSVEAEALFSEYYAKHRRSVMEQQPSLGTAFVFELLCQRWEAEKKAPSTSETPNSSSDLKSSIVLPDDSCGGEEGKSNTQLPNMLSEEGQMTDLTEPKTDEQADVSRKRLRRSKNVSSVQEQGIKAVPSPSAVSGPAEDVPDLTRIVAKPASTPTVMANKVKEKNTKRNEPYELEIYKLNSTCKIEKDNVCLLCEKNGVLIECTGPCGQHFHASCVDLKSQQTVENYICAECTSGTHTCFACKNADMETVKCSVHSCGKYYHEDCIRKYRLSRIESKGFICPLHTCATCAVDNTKNPKAFKGRFYRCVRCPTAYHVGDFCIAAGSVNLAGSHMLCSDHFKPNKAMSCHSRLNITWCFSCSKGGTLLCCESCPAAFHAECVKVEKTPEEAWFCMDCSEGRKPLYGNIVWIKVGNYRWWPGEICHPRHVPMNIQEKAHQVGEFPVRFFGSHDYYWIHKGRVFLFQEGDKGSKEGSSRGLFKAYTKGIEEATDAFKLWTAAKAKKDEQEQERSEKKPAPYKYTKSNVPIGKVQIHKAELSELPRCDCKPDQEDACTTYCLNRLMMYECHPNSCPAGEKCHNQRFQKRQYAGCEAFKSETRGWGLRCLEDIKKGQFVLEYVGDVIDEMECKRRIEQAHEDNITNFYMLTMDKNRIIDAGPRGNFSRFLNHSCCPNMETQKWTVNGDIRVGLFALCDIPKGLELTFNYNLECLGNEKKACACGAENCSGFLGVRPKNAAANDKKTKEPKKKRRKKKLDIRNEYEDECFRCGEGGELVMCDKGNCPKVYHLKCLKLTKPPSGKWLCPWHHCDECGKMATVKCLDCPNSYCSSHTSDNIFKVDDVYICSEHNDILESLPNLPVNSFSSGVNAIRSEVGSKASESSVANTAVGLKGASIEGGDKPSTGTKSEALVVADVKQNGTEGISQVHASLVNTDHALKIGQTDSQGIRPEGNGNAQKVLLAAAAISAAKPVIEINSTEKSVLDKNYTKSVIERNSTEKAVIERNSTEKAVIERNSTEKSIIGRNSTEKSVIGRNLDVSGAINRRVAEPKLKVNSVNEQVDTSSKSTRRIVHQPVKRIEATLCRTKARYKARLSPAGMASADVRTIAVNKPASNHI